MSFFTNLLGSISFESCVCLFWANTEKKEEIFIWIQYFASYQIQKVNIFREHAPGSVLLGKANGWYAGTLLSLTGLLT